MQAKGLAVTVYPCGETPDLPRPLLPRSEWWDQEFADGVHFTGDPVVATPDVTELDFHSEDEFIVLATDGLWSVARRHVPL